MSMFKVPAWVSSAASSASSSSSSSSSTALPDTLLPSSMQPMETVDLEAGGGSSGGGGFGSALWSSMQGMMPVASSAEQQQAEQAAAASWLPSFTLSRQQRLVGAAAALAFAGVCFFLALTLMPTIVLAPRKVLLLLTLGNALAMTSFSLLRGPGAHLRSMISAERAPLTAGYVLSIAGTLYCALVLRSAPLSVLMAGVQLFAVVVYLGTYLPFGSRAMHWTRRALCQMLGRSTAAATSSMTTSTAASG